MILVTKKKNCFAIHLVEYYWSLRKNCFVIHWRRAWERKARRAKCSVGE